MNYERYAYDLARARQRDLLAAAERDRLARSFRPERPTFRDRLRVVTAVTRLARGARRRSRPHPPLCPLQEPACR